MHIPKAEEHLNKHLNSIQGATFRSYSDLYDGSQ